MPITILTWNVYHGNIAGNPPGMQTPMQRISMIANICDVNNIDIICLQEIPGGLLDPLVRFGVPAPGSPIPAGLPANVLADYTILQALSENNSNTPQATPTNDGYLILYRTAVFPGLVNFDYFEEDDFKNLIGAFLRPPVEVQLTDVAGNTIHVMNWHAEADGGGAGWSLEILNSFIDNLMTGPPYTIVAGDFNVRGDFGTVFGGQANFTNFDNVFATYPGAAGNTISGLDHILVNGNATPILEMLLNFRSDAYHYPIAAEI